jgi:plasmid replication initiation protein
MLILRNLFAAQNTHHAPSAPFPATPPPADPIQEVRPDSSAGYFSTARLRNPPPNDKQQDFFVPVIYDIPIKDDVNLMDIAPYRLSTKTQANKLHYKLKNAVITVIAPEQYGLATVKDYDVVIHMISYLNAEMEAYRHGQRKAVPPNRYRPNIYDILKFCRRGDGGKQFKILVDSLDRLSTTYIKIESDDGEDKRAEGFHLIDGWSVVAKSKTGKVVSAEIGIPRWIYNGIVYSETPTILTLHPDYFLLDLPIDRSLYRLARRTAGKGKSSYSLLAVHHRSGSTQPLYWFSRDLRELIGKKHHILDYDLTIMKGEHGELLEMSYTGKQARRAAQPGLPMLQTDTYEKAKRVAPRLDVYALEAEWRAWVRDTEKEPPHHPDAAFINFCKQKFRKMG